MEFAKGHIDLALQTLKEEVFRNLQWGQRFSDRYYFAVANECLWYSCVSLVNLRTNRDVCLSLGDLAFWCRNAGISCQYDNCTLLVQAEYHQFRFIDDSFPRISHWTYGGPTDDNGDYQDYDVETTPLLMSGRSFVRLLKDFDTSVESIYPMVQENVKEYSAMWKRLQIMRASLQPILKERLAGLECYYRLSENEGEYRFEAWVKTSEKHVFGHVTLPFNTIFHSPDNYCGMIRWISDGSHVLYSYGNMVEPVLEHPYGSDIYAIE